MSLYDRGLRCAARFENARQRRQISNIGVRFRNRSAILTLDGILELSGFERSFESPQYRVPMCVDCAST
jgi:hypothetical protein